MGETKCKNNQERGERLTILEKEILTTLSGKSITHFKALGYDLQKYARIDNRGRLTIPARIKIKVRVEDLPRNAGVKVTRICDNLNCDVEGGRKESRPYGKVINVREANKGLDLCRKCSFTQGGKTRRKNMPFENSLQYKAIANNMSHLLEEFSNDNIRTPNEISYSTVDEYLWNCPDCKSEY